MVRVAPDVHNFPRLLIIHFVNNSHLSFQVTSKVYKAIQAAVVARLEGKLPHQKKKVESPLSSLWLTLGDAELNMFALENAELRAYWSALLDMSVRPTRARLLPQRTQPQFPCLMFGGSFHGPRSSGPCSFHVTSTIEPRMR